MGTKAAKVLAPSKVELVVRSAEMPKSTIIMILLFKQTISTRIRGTLLLFFFFLFLIESFKLEMSHEKLLDTKPPVLKVSNGPRPVDGFPFAHQSS